MTSSTDLEMDEMQEIIGDFLIEADELIESLDNDFVKLESSPGDLDLLNEIFRAVHTIKGTSSFLGFELVTTLSHKMEDILNKLRKSEMIVTPEIMDILLEGLDVLKVLLNNVRNKVVEQPNLDDILARLQAVESGGGETSDLSEAPGADSDDGEPAPADTVESTESDAAAGESALPVPDQANVSAASSTGGSQVKSAADQTIRVDVNRLDALMNMTGELVLSRNSLMQSVTRLNVDHEGDWELDALRAAGKSVNFITSELQTAVMKMRMLPIGKVFSRFPRQVRDLARDSGKQIELKMSGESTELDKSVIEEIGDPLMHIIRNSCDHGLELPDERVARGKPPTGTVKLEASQEGSNIVIKVHDDGRGFPAELIRGKAVERGLATREGIDRMSEREIFRFVFEPGFSTAKVVTDISGRGVGMDVVRTNIEKLNGMIELDSRKDTGSTIMIKLPLTLAIIQGLLVECDEEVFILPLSSVYEGVKTEQSDIGYINQHPVLRLRDEIIPLINLVEGLKSGTGAFAMSKKSYILVVGLAEKKLGVMVDRFLGEEEVVIKSMGDYLGSTDGIAGATILGDGRIRLIVDLMGLFSLARNAGH